MEVPGSISGNFCNIFVHLFYPTVTALLEYLDGKFFDIHQIRSKLGA